jgi:hypothetical protein
VNEVPITNLQGFLREKRKIEESASIKNLYLRYESDNTKSYKLYSSEFKAYKSRNKTEEIGKVTQTVEQFIDIANKLMELKPEELVRRHHSSGKKCLD